MEAKVKSELDGGMEMVSIRCRRHKRRFDVPKGWASEVCSWLCPKCYEALTEGERAKYAPCEEPEVRAPEGSRVCMPKGWCQHKEEDGDGKRGVEVKPSKSPSKKPVKNDVVVEKPSIAEEKDDDSVAVEEDVCEVEVGDVKAAKEEAVKPSVNGPKERNPNSPFARIGLDSLLPSYRIYCHKCKRVMPCHGVWFKTSKTMCPMCYSQAGVDEREAFEKTYGCEYPKRHRADGEKSTYIQSSEVKKKPTVKVKLMKDTPYALAKGDIGTKGIDYLIDCQPGMCFKTIRGMRPSDLAAAVRRGSMSQTRANIELRRRKCKGHYNNLPEKHGTPIPYFR